MHPNVSALVPPWGVGYHHTMVRVAASSPPHASIRYSSASRPRKGLVPVGKLPSIKRGRENDPRPTVAFRKPRHRMGRRLRGLARVADDFLLNLIAYNLVRIPRLIAA